MRLLAFLVVVGGAIAAPAGAQDAPFEGFRVAAVGGLDRTDALPGSGARNGALFGVQAGYDFDLGSLVAGLEGDVAGSSASSSVGPVASAADRYATLAVRGGFKLGNRVLVFARGGYANAHVTLTPGGTLDQSGFTVGGGVEAALASPFLLRGEYRYSDYGAKLRGQQFIGGIGLRF